MNQPKPPLTFAAMLVRAQRRFEAVGRTSALMAFPGVEAAQLRPALQRLPQRSSPARK